MILLRVLSLAAFMLTPSESPAADLVERLETLRASHNVPGMALVIVDRTGIRETVALGLADRESERPMTVDTLTRIGSVTKTFNAIGLLRLQAAGRLELEEVLHEIAPELPLINPWKDEHPVRLVHLIEHTAGLADMTPAEFAHNVPFDSLRAAFDFAPEARRVLWPPGRFPQYSNVGAAYLGYVIEQRSGMRYETFMQHEVLVPLGLDGATLHADPRTLERLATGYDSDGESIIPYWHMVFPPLGAINATAQEMSALPRFFLNRGRIGDKVYLSSDTITGMERPRSSVGARVGLSYGHGLGVEQEIDQGRVWFGHGGDGDGYLSHFAYQPALGVGYFLTFNAFKRGALSDFKRAVQAHLSGVQPALSNAPSSDGPLLPADAAGEYGALIYRFGDAPDATPITLDIQSGHLFLRYPSGNRLELIKVAEGLYRHLDEPLATIALTKVDGRWVLQGDFGSYGRH